MILVDVIYLQSPSPWALFSKILLDRHEHDTRKNDENVNTEKTAAVSCAASSHWARAKRPHKQKRPIVVNGRKIISNHCTFIRSVTKTTRTRIIAIHATRHFLCFALAVIDCLDKCSLCECPFFGMSSLEKSGAVHTRMVHCATLSIRIPIEN